MKSRSFRERGIVIALWALLIVLFIGVGGLAVDSGMLYMHRYYLTEAASAGAMEVMKFRALQGWGAFHDPSQPSNFGAMTTQMEEQINIVGNAAARRNFRVNKGYAATEVLQEEIGEPDDPDPIPYLRFLFEYNLESDTVRVEASYDMRTIFVAAASAMGLPIGCNESITGDPTRCRVVAPGPPSMQLDPAIVELVVDTSGSMNEADSPFPPRINRLREAISNFARRFNPNRDFLGLVWFQTAAKELIPLSRLGDNLEMFQLTGPRGLENTLNAGGNTNITDGLLVARKSLETFQQVVEPQQNRQFSVVLFTDGAPNASRVKFRDVWDRSTSTVLDLNKVRNGVVIGEYSRCLADPGTRDSEYKRGNNTDDWFVYRNDKIMQCSDFIDNDNDGAIDFPLDLGCSSLQDDSEASFNDPPTLARDYPSIVHITSRNELLYEDTTLQRSFSFRSKQVMASPSCNDNLNYAYYPAPRQQRNKAVWTGGVALNFALLLKTFDFELPELSGYGGTGLTWTSTNYMYDQYGPVKGYSGASSTVRSDIQYRHSFSDQLAYYSAIEAADAIRALGPGGRIYAIGLGTPINSVNCNNPLQASGNWKAQKPFFLERVALSIDDMFPGGTPTIAATHRFEREATEDRTLTVNCPGAPDHGDLIQVGYTPLAQQQKPWQQPGFDPEDLRDRAGMYMAVERPEMLNRAFASVGTQILLRLVDRIP